jgi:hypothetical protein
MDMILIYCHPLHILAAYLPSILLNNMLSLIPSRSRDVSFATMTDANIAYYPIDPTGKFLRD